MDPETINIPNNFKSPLTPEEEDRAFADNVWRALNEIGVDPFKIICPAFFACAKEFREGRFTKSDFQRAVNNLAILRGL